MISLVKSLENINIRPPFRLSNDLQTYPNSLREMVRIMNLPIPKIKTLKHRRVHDFTEENAQGIAYGFGNVWYLSSEKNIFKFIVNGENIYENPAFIKEKSKSISELLSELNIANKNYDHIGDIDFFEDILFVNLRYKKNLKNPLLLALSENLEVIGYSLLPVDVKDAWCAINPWDQMLYVEKNNNAGPTILAVYDISRLLKLKNQLWRWGQRCSVKFKKNYSFLRNGAPESVPSIQGIVFSANGRIYVTRYFQSQKLCVLGMGCKTVGWRNYISVFSSLTGEILDTSNEINFLGAGDEIEGLSIHPSGVIYISVADNDGLFGGSDEFEIHAFRYPDAAHPI